MRAEASGVGAVLDAVARFPDHQATPKAPIADAVRGVRAEASGVGADRADASGVGAVLASERADASGVGATRAEASGVGADRADASGVGAVLASERADASGVGATRAEASGVGADLADASGVGATRAEASGVGVDRADDTALTSRASRVPDRALAIWSPDLIIVNVAGEMAPSTVPSFAATSSTRAASACRPSCVRALA